MQLSEYELAYSREIIFIYDSLTGCKTAYTASYSFLIFSRVQTQATSPSRTQTAHILCYITSQYLTHTEIPEYVESPIYSPGSGNDRQTSLYFRIGRELAVTTKISKTTAVQCVRLQPGREPPNKERPATADVAQGYFRADTFSV